MKKQIEFIGVEDKATNIYSKFTFQEFWQFINPEEKFTYEVRFKNTLDKDAPLAPFIRECAKTYKNILPYHWTGVFVKTWEEYRHACVFALKNKLTVYLSANPKRPSIHTKDQSHRIQFNGEKQSDECVFSLLIDFDATDLCKEEAKEKASEHAYIQAKKFLQEKTNIKSYLMLCTGNGVQIRIPLDQTVWLPKPTYDPQSQFVVTDEYDVLSRIFKVAMTPVVEKYKTKYVKPDNTSFELARVGRGPFSINWKNKDRPLHAGIIEIVNEGPNMGLTDYIKSFETQAKQFKTQNITLEKNPVLFREFTYTVENIHMSRLARLLTTEKLPSGGRNNVLFFQFKLLCKNNGIDITDPKIRDLVRDMERIQGDNFPLNTPANGSFHPHAIINWCLEQNIKPIYEPLYMISRKKRELSSEMFEFKPKSSGGPLPDGYNFIDRIRKYIALKEIRWAHPLFLKLDIQDLLWSIYLTYDKEKVEYLIDTGTLKTILEKI